MRTLDGKIALVTGGGTGIGRATSIMFAERGAKVVVTDFRPETGEETVNLIRKAGNEAVFAKVDVRIAADVERAVNLAVHTYGALNVAFNNAGTFSRDGVRLADTDDDLADAIIDTNLKGVRMCMKYEIPVMLPQGGGVIINNSSMFGLGAFPGQTAYAAAKHGVVGLTNSAAIEYAPFKIRIVAVCPGWMDTPMLKHVLDNPELSKLIIDSTPVKRVGKPEEVAELVSWLASDAASYCYGGTILISGGLCR
jgi:NAD(P)-dependent dehydrogenase (short-subunit alcohol dehydrogenase family)